MGTIKRKQKAHLVEKAIVQTKKIDSNKQQNDESELGIMDVFGSWNEDEVMTVDLPLPESQSIQLTGHFDETQAIVIDGKHLVILKVKFKDEFKFISGCGTCVNLNSDFLLYIESSCLFESSITSNLLNCLHLRAAASLLISNLNSWKSKVSETEIQNLLLKNLNWKTDTNFFSSLLCHKYCGSLNPNDGIILFELKNNNWRCSVCKYQLASKCRHGHTMNFPENIDDENTCLIIPETMTTRKTVNILSFQRFTSKYLDEIMEVFIVFLKN